MRFIQQSERHTDHLKISFIIDNKMMVNEINKNNVPWPSTIPQQMPWMSSYEPNPMGMQFNASQSAATLIPPVMQPTSTFMMNNQPSQMTITPNIAPLITATSFDKGIISNHPSLTAMSPQPTHAKRTSFELDDPADMVNEPATKQLLTERKLFKQFGSLQLDSIPNLSNQSSDSDDSEEDDIMSGASKKSTFVQSREEFQRYVYLLFKDKNRKSPMTHTYDTIERLAREERDKLSKALVLWNPPSKHNFFDQFQGSEGLSVDSDSSDDDDMKYSDHTDFLKKEFRTEDSVVITDVTDQYCSPSLPVNSQPSCMDPDDIMME